MTRAAWAAGALAVLAAGAPAVVAAQDVDVNVTSTTQLAWHGDNDDGSPFDDDYLGGHERLNVSSAYGRWAYALRLDVAGFGSAPTSAQAPGALENRYDNHASLEKVSAVYASRAVDLSLGDAYVGFGRGLGLSLRKVDELGLDTTLRGAKLVWRGARFTATAAAGTPNIVNVDEASGRLADDPYDLVAGTQLGVKLPFGTAGFHVETVAFRDPLAFVPEGVMTPTYADRWVLGGPVFDAPRLTSSTSLYVEGIVQDRASAQGFGAYGALAWFRGAVTVLVEGKAYGDLRAVQPRWGETEQEFSTVQYTAAPTLERLLQPLEHEQREQLGGRVRADYRFSPTLRAHANYGLLRDGLGFQVQVFSDRPPELVAGTVHDPYAGLDWSFDEARSRLSLGGGWRRTIADVTGELVRSDLHVEADLALALPGRRSLELHGWHLERAKLEAPFIDEAWREGTLQAAFHFARGLGVAASWDYSTEPQLPKTHYFSGGVEWQPSSRAALALSAGSTRGGLKCVSGVCRTVPAFEGARLQITLRY